MNFSIYTHDLNNHVRVHVGTCRFCKEGKGTRIIHHPDARWQGPFDTLEAAKVFAKTIKKKDTYTCGHLGDGRRF